MMKAYTDIEQSKKLAEILTIESADMYYSKHSFENYYSPIPHIGNYSVIHDQIPCWSLAALLSVLDFPSLTQNKEDEWEMCIPDCESDGYIEVPADNPVDACYEMILKLHELKML